MSAVCQRMSAGVQRMSAAGQYRYTCARSSTAAYTSSTYVRCSRAPRLQRTYVLDMYAAVLDLGGTRYRPSPGGARSRRCEIPTKPDAAAAVPAGLVGDGSPGESPGGATDDVTGLLGHGPVDIWAQQPLQPAPASSSQQLVALMLNGATRFSRRGSRGLGR